RDPLGPLDAADGWVRRHRASASGSGVRFHPGDRAHGQNAHGERACRARSKRAKGHPEAGSRPRPLHPGVAKRPAGPLARDVSELNAVKKILVGEDVELNRDLLVQLLEDDYEVLTAVNGEEGIALAQRERPDLVLMDLSLPVIDGWEATRRIKANQDLKG